MITTEWDAWSDIDWFAIAAAMRGDLVLDGRNCIDPDRVVAAGLIYAGTGRLAEPLGPGERI